MTVTSANDYITKAKDRWLMLSLPLPNSLYARIKKSRWCTMIAPPLFELNGKENDFLYARLAKYFDYNSYQWNVYGLLTF